MTDTEIFEPEGRAVPYAVEGVGPAVVLIAGQGLNITSLAALAHSVAMEDFRVVRIGSRRPSAETDAVAMRDLADDIVAVMDHLSIDHAWVGGHAFGGSVARTVSLGHPDRVNGVLLLGVEDPDQRPTDLSEIPAAYSDFEVLTMQAAAWEAPAALAPSIPVLVIQGSEDDVTPPANGEALQASAPGLVSTVLIDGGGHLFAVTHVGATSWAIEDYLDWD